MTEEQQLDELRQAIVEVVARRDQLKRDMEAWYGQNRSRFPGALHLERIDRQLAELDTRFKRLWDARHGR